MLERVITCPDPYEPFLLSQGIKANGWLFISGQAGAGEDGRIVPGGFLAQGGQAFANLRRALEAGGAGLKDVVKVTIFVTDMGHFDDVVTLRRRFFSAPYRPASGNGLSLAAPPGATRYRAGDRQRLAACSGPRHSG